MSAVDEWLDLLLGLVTPLPSEPVPVAAAIGRTLAQDVQAAHPLPPWDSSAMDGFAIRTADAAAATSAEPAVFTVTGEIAAGSDSDAVLEPGTAVRIMTGAPVPTGADSIVRFELADVDSPAAFHGTERFSLTAPVAAGADIRRAGEDVAPGGPVADAGTLITPILASAIAASGRAHVETHRRPRAALIITGSELVPPGEKLRRGQIPESNSVLIAGLLAEAGAECVSVQRVEDSAEELEAALAEAERLADVVLLTGGIGPGAHDVVRAVLEARDSVRFTSLPLRPGKLQCAGTVGGSLLFGLSGNPFAAAVSFELFARPCILALQGRSTVTRDRFTARAGSVFRSRRGVLQAVPVSIAPAADGLLECEPLIRGRGISHSVVGGGGSNAFALISEDRDTIERGEAVTVIAW